MALMIGMGTCAGLVGFLGQAVARVDLRFLHGLRLAKN